MKLLKRKPKIVKMMLGDRLYIRVRSREGYHELVLESLDHMPGGRVTATFVSVETYLAE